jgi:hypothetical protein
MIANYRQQHTSRHFRERSGAEIFLNKNFRQAGHIRIIKQHKI